jgi:hypothetical protein
MIENFTDASSAFRSSRFAAGRLAVFTRPPALHFYEPLP